MCPGSNQQNNIVREYKQITQSQHEPKFNLNRFRVLFCTGTFTSSKSELARISKQKFVVGFEFCFSSKVRMISASAGPTEAVQGCKPCKADETCYSRNINFLANFSTNGYVFTQNTIALDFPSTYPS